MLVGATAMPHSGIFSKVCLGVKLVGQRKQADMLYARMSLGVCVFEG